MSSGLSTPSSEPRREGPALAQTSSGDARPVTLRNRINNVMGSSLHTMRLFPNRLSAKLLNSRGIQHYSHVDKGALLERKKSDTVFIFGSGRSINDVTTEEWTGFRDHDVITFNWFIHQDHIPVDYHLVREIAPTDLDPEIWRPKIEEYGRLIQNNPHYRDTVFLIQDGWKATNGNRLIGHGLLPHGAQVYRFHNRYQTPDEPPTGSFEEGLAHSSGTLSDCVNFAYLMGWQKIVLVGVDLYDRRYFWLDPDERTLIDEMRNARPDDRHNMADPTVVCLSNWGRLFEEEGIELMVHNPRSLLAGPLPVYPGLRD